jgi:hypothetical protein
MQAAVACSAEAQFRDKTGKTLPPALQQLRECADAMNKAFLCLLA